MTFNLPRKFIHPNYLTKKHYLTLPYSQKEIWAPSDAEITFIADVDSNSVDAFRLTSVHFPNTWGFLWTMKTNSLSKTILHFSEDEREKCYKEIAMRSHTWLKENVNQTDRCDIIDDGLIRFGGERGKRIISEAYQCLGVPPLISYGSDLVLADLKNKVPLKWILTKCPVAFNIHPAPPEKPGAGSYISSLLGGEKAYGVTVHYITEDVDDGPIISVRRYPIPEGSTEQSLRVLTRYQCLELLEDLLLHIKVTKPINEIPTSCHYIWRGTEITRKMARMMARNPALDKSCD